MVLEIATLTTHLAICCGIILTIGVVLQICVCVAFAQILISLLKEIVDFSMSTTLIFDLDKFTLELVFDEIHIV